MEVQRTENFGQSSVENNILEPPPNFLNSLNYSAPLAGVQKADSSQTHPITNKFDHERVRSGGTSMSGVNNSNNSFGMDVSSGPLLGGILRHFIRYYICYYASSHFGMYITIYDG